MLGYTRNLLLTGWHNLGLAIEEYLTSKQEDGQTPCVLTSIFMRNAKNQKSPLDRMFEEQEKLKM
jgi:hypothetical protein